MSNRNIGKMIKSEREKQRYTIRKLAEMTGYSEKHLGQIERGINKPSVECIMKIGDVLNTTFVTREYLDFLNSTERKNIITTLKIYRDILKIDADLDAITVDYLKYEKVKNKFRYSMKTILKDLKENEQ